MKAADKASGSRRSWLWLQGAGAGAIAVTLPATTLLIVTLLAPAFAAYGMEKTPGRPIAKIMLLTGSAATMLPLRTLLEHGNSLVVALDILGDPACPLLAWAGCASGWLLSEVVQLAARLALAGQSRRTIEILRREEAELREEWTLADGGPPS